MVGSNQGQVHSERQGTGLATVLQGDRAYAEGQQQLGQYQLDRKAKQAELKGRRDAAWKALNDFHPEYWDKDNVAIQSELDALVDEGGRLIAQSKTGDPFTDVTPEALAFQKKFNIVRGLAQKSKQAMAEDIAIRAELKGKNVEDYNAQDLAAYKSWLETPISERGQAPIIGKAAPLVDLFTTSGSLAKALGDQYVDAQVPDNVLIDAVVDQMRNPKFAADMAKSAAQAMASMSDAELRAVKESAELNAIDPASQAYADMVKRRMKAQKPFELVSFFDDVAKGLDVEVFKQGGQEGVRTGYNREKILKAIYDRAFAKTLDDPRSVRKMIDEGLIDGSGDELSDRKNAAEYTVKQVDPLIKKPEVGFVARQKSESERTAGEDIANSNKWYSNLMSGDLGLKERAATELPMRKMPDGSTIESASIFTQTQKDGSQKSFMAIQLNPRKEVSGKGISDEMLDAEKQRLAATETTVIEMLPAPEREEYEGLDAAGKKVKEKDLLRQNILAPKVIIELKPENENLLKNLYNPEAKAMASSYSAGQKGSLLGPLATAKPIEKTAIKKAPLNVRGK